MNKTVEDIMNRRSIRRYKPERVSDAEVETVVRAGMCAPSGMNLQSPIIIAIQNEDTVRRLSELNAKVRGSSGDPFYGAKTAIVVLAESDSRYVLQDGSLVMGNMMNAAYAIGLGSCWIHRAEAVFASEEGKALLKEWGIEGDYTGVATCILGYPDENPAIKPRKENYVYYVK